MTGHSWAIVLAAGDGTRLRSLTRDRRGVAVPKQFCSLDGGPSLMALSLERATGVVPRGRITCVVAPQHREWWHSELSEVPEENVIVQPENRGTAQGVLLPLLRILERDPDAQVFLLPSDHFVADESVLARVMRRAIELMERGSPNLFLLGIMPDEPDSGFGWIVPAKPDGRSVYRVDRFVEKPPPAVAADLMLQGGVWNSFIIAASGMAMLAMFQRRLPEVATRMQAALRRNAGNGRGDAALVELYHGMETHDFCRDVLQGEEDNLRVLPVPQCGWSDLGTPERVACCLDRWRPAMAHHGASWAIPFDAHLPRGNAGPVLSANLSRLPTARLAGASREGITAEETALGSRRAKGRSLLHLARATR